MLIVSIIASIVFLGGWLSPFELVNLPYFDLPDSMIIAVFGA